MKQAPWIELAERLEALELLQPCIQGTVHPLAVIDGVLELGEGSEIKAGTLIEGHVRIGKHCSIGPNAYLRGYCDIGNHCRVGHAVEVKDSVLGESVFIAHLSYIGDSLIEDDVNLGGGCITSNFRHDAGEIRMPWQGRLHATGRNKLGAYIQQSCRIGCNSVILPGRVLEQGSWIPPSTVVH